MLIADVAGSAATPVRACSPRVYPGDSGGCAQVRRSAGAGVPGQEAVQVRAGEGFPAVSVAFVEVAARCYTIRVLVSSDC